MSEKTVNKIKSLLNESEIQYEYLEHEPTPTSEDSARVRGTPLHEGAKALILRYKKVPTDHGLSPENIMAVLPGDKKIDFKKFDKITGGEMTFEKPEVIDEKYEVKIGGVPPIGMIFGLKTYFDKSILRNENASFNCGLPTASIIMKVEDLIKVAEGEIAEFSKS